MPLLDHFHPPLYPHRAWESFHSRWANSIADKLNGTLPERFFAEVQLHLGSQVAADVAEFATSAETTEDSGNRASGAVALQTWAPPVATWVMPALFPDNFEIHVRDELDDARLVAVVELISPRNKDRAESRRTFAAKCAAYLQRGIGLVVVDIVTGRQFNLHNELVQILAQSAAFAMSQDAFLYAVSYRPVQREEASQIDVWPVALTLDASLPVLPLALRGYGTLRLDLEETYHDACQRSRL